MKKQVKVIYIGMVQGVGFRFTAERLSRHFQVTGYAKNLPDGTVELLAEGEETVLRDFLHAVRESKMSPYIRDMKVNWSEAEGRFEHFGIAY